MDIIFSNFIRYEYDKYRLAGQHIFLEPTSESYLETLYVACNKKDGQNISVCSATLSLAAKYYVNKCS